jgi:hypothetical protein
MASQRSSPRAVLHLLLMLTSEAFLDLMMIEELGIMPSDQTIVPWKSALATFFSFLLLGGAPMLPYLFSISYSTVGRIGMRTYAH